MIKTGTIQRILIDWGTSSFRLWGLNAADDVVEEKQAPLGMTKLEPSQYEEILEEMLSQLGVMTDVPVLICGMAGAAQGWQEAKYIDLPTKLEQISDHAIRVKTSGRDVRILPGLAQRDTSQPDVMRGEETILLGAKVKNYSYQNYCMPGTHSKWVEMRDDGVQSFHTFMTGEMFALLSEHSTLSHFVSMSAEVTGSFEEAVQEINNQPNMLTSALFSIRSGNLLFADGNVQNATSRLSGLLIGSELAAMKSQIHGNIGLIAQTDLYQRAMDVMGIRYEMINAQDLALSGLKFCAGQLWPNQKVVMR